jgi:hypothetical protein
MPLLIRKMGPNIDQESARTGQKAKGEKLEGKRKVEPAAQQDGRNS